MTSTNTTGAILRDAKLSASNPTDTTSKGPHQSAIAKHALTGTPSKNASVSRQTLTSTGRKS